MEHRAQEDEQGGPVMLQNGMEGLTWDEKHLAASNLLVLMMDRLAGDPACRYVIEFLAQFPVESVQDLVIR
jgi:hypothetical protein